MADDESLVKPDVLPEKGPDEVRGFGLLNRYTAKMMIGMRSNRLELWLLVGVNVIIVGVIVYAVLS